MFGIVHWCTLSWLGSSRKEQQIHVGHRIPISQYLFYIHHGTSSFQSDHYNTSAGKKYFRLFKWKNVFCFYFQEGHNIFGKLCNNDYKQLLGLIKHCILATDLAVFFPNKAKLGELVKTNSFLWTNTEHRRLILAIAMTGSDLCASAKPWDIQVETVKVTRFFVVYTNNSKNNFRW